MILFLKLDFPLPTLLAFESTRDSQGNWLCSENWCEEEDKKGQTQPPQTSQGVLETVAVWPSCPLLVCTQIAMDTPTPPLVSEKEKV